MKTIIICTLLAAGLLAVNINSTYAQNTTINPSRSDKHPAAAVPGAAPKAQQSKIKIIEIKGDQSPERASNKGKPNSAAPAKLKNKAFFEKEVVR